MTDMTLGRWSHLPAISIFSSSIVWHGAKPRTPHRDIVRLSQSEIFVVLRIFIHSDLRLGTSVQHSDFWAWMIIGTLW